MSTKGSTLYFTTETLDFIPDLLALHASDAKKYPNLLQSNVQGTNQARYDILFACPQETIFYQEKSFFDQIDKTFIAQQCDALNIDLPFYGGWFLYLGYELVKDIEPNLNLPKATDGLPIAYATRFPAAIIIDHKTNEALIICENEFINLIDEIKFDLQILTSKQYQQDVVIDELIEDDVEPYLEQVKRIKQYIVDGDIFQVNLSRAWKTALKQTVNHASLFHKLTQTNPGPFNALVTLDDKAIISSSPERLIEVRKGIIETRPIAGTRPRSENEKDDQALSSELMSHPKEKAEHIMLIDLERNDLGRICKPGTVKVNELMALETYQHVHHIVSNVKGELKDNTTPSDVIKAVFPGGTITGCPKVRCMEILAELEKTGRGAYTGSLGYLNRDGSMDLNILIRTIVRNGDQLMFRAGGGIVADSDPEHELNETRAKAKGLIMALR